MEINSLPSIDSVLTELAENLGIMECSPGLYLGSSLEYATWNYNISGDAYADDGEEEALYSVQFHYVCPIQKNSIKMREAIRSEIRRTFGTAPDVVDGTDKDGQHYVFEFEVLEGDLWQT